MVLFGGGFLKTLGFSFLFFFLGFGLFFFFVPNSGQTGQAWLGPATHSGWGGDMVGGEGGGGGDLVVQNSGQAVLAQLGPSQYSGQGGDWAVPNSGMTGQSWLVHSPHSGHLGRADLGGDWAVPNSG